jgi:hypothetical protein
MVELIRYDENEVICSIIKHNFIYNLKNFAECSTYCKMYEEAYLHICIQWFGAKIFLYAPVTKFILLLKWKEKHYIVWYVQKL